MNVYKAFWHKGARSQVGSKVVNGRTGIAIDETNAENVKAAGEVHFTIAATGGIVYTDATASTQIDISGLTTVHADNVETSDYLGNKTRQNAAGLVVATANQVYVVFTLDKDGNEYATAGQIVSTSATARRPVMDLTNQCAWGEVLISNASGSDFTIGTTALSASNVTDTYNSLDGSLPVE